MNQAAQIPQGPVTQTVQVVTNISIVQTMTIPKEGQMTQTIQIPQITYALPVPQVHLTMQPTQIIPNVRATEVKQIPPTPKLKIIQNAETHVASLYVLRKFINERCIVCDELKISIEHLKSALEIYIIDKDIWTNVMIDFNAIIKEIEDIKKIRDTIEDKIYLHGVCLQHKYRLRSAKERTEEQEQLKNVLNLYRDIYNSYIPDWNPRKNHIEFIKRMNIDKVAYEHRKNYFLNRYVLDEHGHVDWDKTVVKSNKAVKKFIVHIAARRSKRIEEQHGVDTLQSQRLINDIIAQYKMTDTVRSEIHRRVVKFLTIFAKIYENLKNLGVNNDERREEHVQPIIKENEQKPVPILGRNARSSSKRRNRTY